MKPNFISHKAYQDFLFSGLTQYYSGGLLVLVNNDWPLIYKLWITDLSKIHNLLIDEYSIKGPTGYAPSNMLRSYLLYLFVSPTIGLTEWANQLKRVPLYAILSGFNIGETPAVGTFYDFLDRLWLSDQDNTKKHVKYKKTKKRKGKKPKKGEKAPMRKPGIVTRLVERFLKYGSSKKNRDTDRLFEFFHSQFLEVSASFGLLGNLNAFSISGDGTPVETCAYPRYKKLPDDKEYDIYNRDKQIFSQQPDINSGWDSSRDKFYNGYDLYMITACDSFNDLPIYPKLNKASLHDSVGLLLNLNEFFHRFNICPIDKILLDSAHDAKAIYKLLFKYDVEPFIDLNKRTKFIFENKSDITVSDQGIPICKRGIEMKSNGFDYTKNRKKWRCGNAKGTFIDCPNPCSKAKYGRNFQTNPKDDLRIFTKTPRGSDKWKKTYNRRTSSERTNKREKVDYHLEAGRHRSTKMWYIRLYGIMMCQHIDAWYLHLKDTLDLQKQLTA